MKLHYSQTIWRKLETHQLFQYLMKLHYSQTHSSVKIYTSLFQYLMKLHYSQTTLLYFDWKSLFQYLMKLHYSQTSAVTAKSSRGFSTLWNYTTLKLHKIITSIIEVSVPYEITLLSNGFVHIEECYKVSVPYEITLLSNYTNFACKGC